MNGITEEALILVLVAAPFALVALVAVLRGYNLAAWRPGTSSRSPRAPHDRNDEAGTPGGMVDT